MGTITIWLIVLMTNTGQRLEMGQQYNTEKECLAAVEAIQKTHPGTSATCSAKTVAVSEERAKQLAIEEWWRTRPPETAAPEKGKR